MYKSLVKSVQTLKMNTSEETKLNSFQYQCKNALLIFWPNIGSVTELNTLTNMKSRSQEVRRRRCPHESRAITIAWLLWHANLKWNGELAGQNTHEEEQLRMYIKHATWMEDIGRGQGGIAKDSSRRIASWPYVPLGSRRIGEVIRIMQAR